jgi:uncharacterized membrane protein
MPRWEHSIDISATPERVWQVMADIERWPDWTPSIISVRKLSDGPFGAGTAAAVRARGTPESTWTVTEAAPTRSFTWETRVRGARTVAGHVIDAAPGGARVVLSVEIGGIAAALLKPILGRGIRENLRLEAEGLKRQSETAA